MISIQKAEEENIPDIIDLLEPYVAEGIVLRRTYEEIQAERHCFYVAYVDGLAEGVISYHDYDNQLYEIRSLVVNKKFSRKGIGRQLVEFVIDLLRNEHPACRIFALTYVPDFFYKLNFIQLDKSKLPEKIWKDCNNCPKKDCCTEIPVLFNG